MFENILKFFKKAQKEKAVPTDSKSAAKERLHLVLMQDRANVSADFLDLMKQEIIEVIKKYIEVDENAMDVRLTNKENEDGTNGAPALYANIPILNIKNEARKVDGKEKNKIDDEKAETKKEVQDSEKVAIKETTVSEKENSKEKESNEEKAENIEEVKVEKIKEEDKKVESTAENK